MKQKNKKQNTPAEKNYEQSFYQSTNDDEQGLAITHEQVNDTLTEGTIEYKNEREE